MPDLNDDLRRYGAALTSRVEPVDVDAIVSGAATGLRFGRRPTARQVLLVVAAAIVLVVVTVALVISGSDSTGIDTVGQPDGPPPTVQDPTTPTSSPPDAPRFEVGPDGADALSGQELLASTRADFNLPPGGEFLEFREVFLITEGELRDAVAFQAACAWMAFVSTEVTAGHDLSRAADGIQDLKEHPEIDRVLRGFLTDAVSEGRSGRTSAADEFIANNCSLPPLASDESAAFMDRLTPDEIAASEAAMDPFEQASFAELRGHFEAGRHPVADHHGNSLGTISTATLDDVVHPTSIAALGEVIGPDGHLAGFWAGDLGAFTLAEVMDPTFDLTALRRSAERSG